MRRARLVLVLVVLPLLVAATVAAPPGAPAGAGTRPKGDDLRIVNYNILHGTFCDDAAGCQAPDRVALFLRQLEEARCPAVVGLQEVNAALREILAEQVPEVCDGRYEAVFADVEGNDAEYVLTTLPVGRSKVVGLPGGLRRASRVVLESALGPVVLVVTHQDGDKAFPTCRSDIDRYRCPKPCPDGTTYSTCQTILGQRLAERGGPKTAIRVYMGDFNVPPGSPRYESLLADGWVDSHVAAGNPECDPTTGLQCTAGREDQAIAALKDPAARQHERIDFVFVKAPSTCRAGFDPVGDPDGDGLGTGLFAATPAVEGPGGLVWPSDHTAVSMDLSCA